ncbi:MAG TPA: hypothetical protein PK293_06740 [Spirochaetota bacterium]|mgnify:CR=1 FL=1|nr:hypothetical protein [Spirochaetota bacterium]HPF05716.1 hypothetical protein [Spirochaetota bacterium]HPJ42799.1 hypothetical protein [Spirochaetota bacterium]
MNPVIANSRLVNEIVSFILNLIGKKNTYRITVTGKDYSRLEILWGMVLIEKGEKREIEITGTEKYFEHYVKNLEKNQFRVKRLPK